MIFKINTVGNQGPHAFCKFLTKSNITIVQRPRGVTFQKQNDYMLGLFCKYLLRFINPTQHDHAPANWCHCAFAALLKLYSRLMRNRESTARQRTRHWQWRVTPAPGGASPAAAARSKTAGTGVPAERADAASDCGPRESRIARARASIVCHH